MILPTDCVYFCQEANKQSVVIPGHWWVLQATSSFVGPEQCPVLRQLLISVVVPPPHVTEHGLIGIQALKAVKS